MSNNVFPSPPPTHPPNWYVLAEVPLTVQAVRQFERQLVIDYSQLTNAPPDLTPSVESLNARVTALERNQTGGGAPVGVRFSHVWEGVATDGITQGLRFASAGLPVRLTAWRLRAFHADGTPTEATASLQILRRRDTSVEDMVGASGAAPYLNAESSRTMEVTNWAITDLAADDEMLVVPVNHTPMTSVLLVLDIDAETLEV